ncbi:MAG: hypothetical protein ABIS06_11315 [Vicinamibacterales bacterium]
MTQNKVFKGRWAQLAAIAALVLLPAMASAQQTTVTSSDIQRLQDDVYQASSDLSRLRSTDRDAAARLETQLDDLRDEIVYLKVKMRKEGNVSRSEYADLRDRVSALRSQARGERTDSSSAAGERRGTWQPPAGASTGGTTSGSNSGVYSGDRRSQSGSQSVIPEGQEVDVRLQSVLSSDTAQVEDRFEATTVVDLYRDNDVLIPAGSVLRGVVRTVDKATRTDRKGALTVSFDQVTVRGRTYPMRGTVTQAIESEGVKGEASKIGAGAGVGAIIGGILGGVKGALLGVLIGGGGTIAATEGKDVTLPAGTVLRVRLDTPPNIR